jgi:hypothetical protein
MKLMQDRVERTYTIGEGESSSEIVVEVTTDPSLSSGDRYLSIKNIENDEGLTIDPYNIAELIRVLELVKTDVK